MKVTFDVLRTLLRMRACVRTDRQAQLYIAGVHNAKAEECTIPRIGSRNIEIKIGGGGLPRNQK